MIQKATAFCLLGLVLIFVALVYLPERLRTKTYQFETKSAPSEKPFPVEHPLAWVKGTSLGAKTTLREIAKAEPNGILVNLWATWCPPCLEELPSLEYLHRQIKARKDLPPLITISVDERPSDVAKLFKTLDFAPSFPVLYDKDGELSRSVGTTKFPETFWIKGDGKIVHKWVGPQNWLAAGILERLESKE